MNLACIACSPRETKHGEMTAQLQLSTSLAQNVSCLKVRPCRVEPPRSLMTTRESAMPQPSFQHRPAPFCSLHTDPSSRAAFKISNASLMT
jgi:hypothetical protein